MFSGFVYWTAIKIIEKIVRDKKVQVPLQAIPRVIRGTPRNGNSVNLYIRLI